jgi:hypothetical protein
MDDWHRGRLRLRRAEGVLWNKCRVQEDAEKERGGKNEGKRCGAHDRLDQ